MVNNEDTTFETLSDELDVGSTDGGEAVGDITEDTSSGSEQTSTGKDPVVEALSNVLGKDFKDRETALKSVKDTFSYVGKRKEAIASEVTADKNSKEFVSREEYQRDMFYAQHPEYKPLKDVIDSMAVAQKQLLDKVVESEPFKNVFEAYKGYTETKNAKSVLESNPRLGAQRDKITKSKEALKTGDYRSAENEAVSAVLESLE